MKINMTSGFIKDLVRLNHPLNKIKGWFYDIKNGICNIFKWLPVIWKARDWDHAYIWNLLYHKLIFMESHHQKYNPFVSKHKTLHQIQIAKCLAGRLWKQDYLTNALIPVHEIYGETKLEFSKPDENGLVSLVDNDPKKEKDMRRRAYKLSEYMKQQDMNLLFKILNKHMRGWWT